jgi:mannose-6-phosphate isomerase-like protein (cupin superfamily)
MTVENDYTVCRIDDMERAFGGVLARARAELGVTSFGMNVIDLPPDSGDLHPEHDHAHTGQEEVYVVLQGSGELVLPDATCPLDPGVMARVGAATRRRVRSGPDGIRMVVMGGTPGEVFVPQANSEKGAPSVPSPGANVSSSLFKQDSAPGD